MDQGLREPLYQVWCTEVESGKLVPAPWFPRAMKQVTEEWASLMRQQIAAGKLRTHAEPQVLPHLSHLT